VEQVGSHHEIQFIITFNAKSYDMFEHEPKQDEQDGTFFETQLSKVNKWRGQETFA
jgi:hypothetical protein